MSLAGFCGSVLGPDLKIGQETQARGQLWKQKIVNEPARKGRDLVCRIHTALWRWKFSFPQDSTGCLNRWAVSLGL